jgi:hypothetical protein
MVAGVNDIHDTGAFLRRGLIYPPMRYRSVLRIFNFWIALIIFVIREHVLKGCPRQGFVSMQSTVPACGNSICEILCLLHSRHHVGILDRGAMYAID